MNKTIELIKVFNKSIDRFTCNIVKVKIRPCETTHLSSNTCSNCVFNSHPKSKVPNVVYQLAKDYEQTE